jgi:hypothetical protein
MRCAIESHDNAFSIRDGAGKIRTWLDELIDHPRTNSHVLSPPSRTNASGKDAISLPEGNRSSIDHTNSVGKAAF